MASVLSVAKHAGVSTATVSRVINQPEVVSPATREKVEKVMNELGYRPNRFARSLATDRSHMIGVVLHNTQSFSAPANASILISLEQVLRDAGYDMVVSTGFGTEASEKQVVQSMIDARCDALLLYFRNTLSQQLVEWSKQGTKMVVLGKHVPEYSDHCIYLDNKTGGRIATMHLAQNGHHEIAHISGPSNCFAGQARLAGYLSALAQHDITFQGEWLIEGDYREGSGYECARELLARGKISAIFVANDSMATGTYAAIKEAGLRIPEDISVVGFDDVSFGRYLDPPLTTIHQPFDEMGSACAQTLLAEINGASTKDIRKQFLPQFVGRKSVKRCE